MELHSLLFIPFVLGLHRPLAAAVCENIRGDDWCQSKMAEADYCILDEDIRCQCAKECQAPPDCNVPEDDDETCDCPFFAKDCNLSWTMANCNYTCHLVSSVTCPAPTPPTNHTHFLYNEEEMTTPITPAHMMDTATVACDVGYQMTNGTGQPLRRVCGPEGQWVKDPGCQLTPVCQLINCGAPPIVPLTTPSAAIGYYGDHVTYTCNHAHLQVDGGAGRMVCNAMGAWMADGSDPMPVCIGLFVRFISSQSEAQNTSRDMLTSQRTRSGLECASECARHTLCYGYTYDVHTGVCYMNAEAPTPVLTEMKRVLE